MSRYDPWKCYSDDVEVKIPVDGVSFDIRKMDEAIRKMLEDD